MEWNLRRKLSMDADTCQEKARDEKCLVKRGGSERWCTCVIGEEKFIQ